LWYSIGLVLLLSLIGGLIAVNIDMILDPVSVTPPAIGWVWIGGGPYYGIPISNFIGWFLVAAVAILIFRSYELISSKSDSSELSVDSYYNFYIIPIYIMYFLFNAVRALELGRIEYVLIGATTMGPFILITILIFMLKMKKR
jgi:putative membrane protein